MSDVARVEDEIDSEDEVGGGGGQVIALYPAVADERERLDKFVAGKLPDLSRAFLQELVDVGRIVVNGVPVRRSYKITRGDVVTATIPAPTPDEIEPEVIPLDVVYEDDDVIVLDKLAGMVVHPAPGHPSGTLVNALLAHAPEMAVSGSHRPGIVHRLDKDTSGLVVVAKNDRAKLALVSQWQNRTVEKGYIALVRGVVEPEEATIDAPVGRDPANRLRMAAIASGRPAVTHFRVNRRYDDCTLLDVELETGRTHQVRVHLAFIGHPVVGDALYNPNVGPMGGRRALVRRQFLHAATLGFDLPTGRHVRFESTLPSDLQSGLDFLQRESQ
ncbi:MAG: RluA family pseudouridine synthase [Thermomicrobiales bacterium]